jgi:hypothetical protein
MLVDCLLLSSAQSLSSHFLPKNMKIKIHRTIILPVFIGVELGSLQIRDEQGLRSLRTRCRGRYSGLRRRK